VAEPGLPGKRSANGCASRAARSSRVRAPLALLRKRRSGGQHVNTSNTRAEVFFDIEVSTAFDEAQRQLLVERLGRVVRVVASDERSQWRNRRLAAERLGDRLADALEIPPERRPTRPSRREQERRRTSRLRQQAKRNARR